jgi:elongation factor 1-beta
LTKDDIKVYGAVTEKPSGSFPNVATWYDAVSSKLAARYVIFSFCYSIID